MSADGGATWSNAPAVAPYSGSTTNQLTINPTSVGMNGNRFRCEVTNSCTTPSPATSNTAVLTINAAGCGTVITPTSSPSIPAAGGTGSFGINVTPNTCSWSASENLTWVTITSPLSGTGDATLNYTVAVNPGTARSGIITVNGQNYTVNQLGAAAPTTYIISGRVIENGSPGLPGVTISTSPAAGTAITDAQGYYTITVPLSYTGTVTPTLAPFNFTPLSRTVSSTNNSNKDFDAAGVSITITSSVIPPWQREGDDYNGSVTVQINTTTNSWHLEADVYNGTTWLGNVRFPSTTAATYQFNTSLTSPAQNQQLKNWSVNGRTIKYAAVFDANPAIQAYPGISTKIIDSMWKKENIVYFNSGSNSIRIPIKYYESNMTNYKLSIKRINKSAYKLNLPSITCLALESPEPIENNAWITNDFDISADGYVYITKNNSNLEEVLPGDFEYRLYKQGIITQQNLEYSQFDLTKFGKISLTPNTSGKLLIMVGGIFNEMESSVKDLIINSSDVTLNPNSTYSYSVIE
ncbi:MAG: BACON domain-containing carbohydrate-binding protein, partial [Ferruginibacter sp.]